MLTLETLGITQEHISTVLKNLAEKDNIDLYNFRAKKLEENRAKNPPKNMDEDALNALKKSVEFAKKLKEQKAKIPFLLVDSTCRLLTFTGYSTDLHTHLPLNKTRLQNFTIQDLRKNKNRMSPETDKPKHFDISPYILNEKHPDAISGSWIEETSHDGRFYFHPRGYLSSIINDDLMQTNIRIKSAKIQVVDLTILLPVEGKNLFKHPHIQKIVEEYIADVPYEKTLELFENDLKKQKETELRNALDEAKKYISDDIAKSEDFREILEITRINEHLTQEDLRKIQILANSRVSFSSPTIKKTIEKFLEKIRSVPEEADRAILWIGLTDGKWSAHI